MVAEGDLWAVAADNNIRSKMIKKHGLDHGQINELLNQISFHESKYENVQQGGGGPAQGYFQIEPPTLKTMIKQYKNVSGLSDKNLPKWVKDLESGKATLIGENAIDETKQSELVLAMLYQSEGSDKRLKKYAKGDQDQIREIWIEDYNKSHKVNYKMNPDGSKVKITQAEKDAVRQKRLESFDSDIVYLKGRRRISQQGEKTREDLRMDSFLGE